MLWIDAGMRYLPTQRLSTQVQNIEKKLTLSRVERQEIHANVTEINQDLDDKEITIEEEMNTNSSKAPEELRIVWGNVMMNPVNSKDSRKMRNMMIQKTTFHQWKISK